MLRQSEIEFIRDSVIGFAKHQAMKEAIILSMNKLEDPNNYPEILENIQKALSVGSMIEDIGTIGYDVKQVKERFISRNSNTDIKRIPTGFSELDHVLGGGIGSSEFGTIAGTAKSGKSTFLVNIGANILLLKKNVLYITLEMEEDRIMNKFDMRLLGMTKEEIRLPGSLKRMKDIHNNIGNLIVKSFPEYTLKPCDLEVYLNKLKLSYNFMPDIVLVDYADIMAPNTHYNQKRFEIDDIYYNLSSISKKNKLSIITATQTNRESIKKLESGEILDKDSIAESYGISRICCYLFTINSTPADLKQNKIILYIAANRFGEDGIKIKLHANLSTCTIRDLVSTDRKFFN
jgi:replicative DNA helicase